ncbi:MAG: DUF5130 family protein [Actinomycetes bacterium]
MPAGEAFSARQRESIERALHQGEQTSGLTYSVFVGDTEGDPRQAGRRLLGALGSSSAQHVVVVVDPAHRELAILAGSQAAFHLDDRATALAAMSMTSSFSAGDLAGGIVDGLRTLAEHARQPRTLHFDEV